MAAFFALLLTLPAAATIVDRIAVSVGNRVITASDIDLRIRLTAFQNNAKPIFDLATRKQAAELLIDQRLVEREMDVGHYPGLGDEDRKNLEPQDQDARLAEYGLTRAQLAEDLAREQDLVTFLNLRFRQVAEPSSAADQAKNQKADADLEAWLRDQRKRAKIVYVDPELAP